MKLIKPTQIISLTVVLIFSFCFSFVGLVHAATSSISPGSISVGVGQTVSVSVVVTNPGTANAADVIVSYDSNLLQPVSIQAGPTMSGFIGGSTSPNFQISVFKSGGATFTNGEVLATLTFQGKALGTTSLNTSSTQFSPGSNSGAQSGTVTVVSGNLPQTSIPEGTLQIALILFGVTIVIVGVVLYLQARNARSNNTLQQSV